jgi:LuxR family maltose regulon positive regulatory protein
MVDSAEKFRVLRTKFCPPNLSSDLVNRDRLIELLRGSQEVPLTLVSAPAGYGKSVLVSQWLDQYEGLSFWLSLDKADSSLRRFSAHLISNFQLQLPDHFQTTGKLLHSTDQIPVTALSACLLNDLLRLDRPCTLVLDDYHVLRADSSVHELLGAFLEHPPPTAHIILVTRNDPPLELIRYRAANVLLEVREFDLCFDSAESSRLISNLTGTVPSNEALINLDKQLEGWAAGLRLTSLVLNKTEDPDAFLKSIRGGIPAIQEYLLSEVVAGLDSNLREVVLKSSLLDRFCEELVAYVCEFSSGTPPSGAGAIKLIDLIRHENLFIISLDNGGRWYRYHHLFQYLLQSELSSVADTDIIAECHLRASQWFESRNLPDEAVKHAKLAGDEDYAAGIIERNSYELLEIDQWYVLDEWLCQLSTEVVKKRPKLLLMKAWTASYQQQLERAQEFIELIPPLLEKQQRGDEFWGEVDLFRGIQSFWNGNFEESIRRLTRAQDRIPESKAHAIAEVDLYLGIVTYMDGRKDDAVRMMDHQMRRYGVQHLARRFATLAFVHAMSGELNELQVVANRMLAMDVFMRSPLTDAWAHYFLGLAALHSFRLETAISCFEKVIEIPYLPDRRAAIDAFSGLALAQQLQGQPELALGTLNGFASFVHEHRRPEELAILHACRTRIGLLQEADQVQLADHYPVPEACGIFDLFMWVETLAMSRIRRLLSEGSEQSVADAQALIDQVRGLSQTACLTCQLIEVEVLQTLLHKRLDREEAALESLGESLALASHGGWIRPFVEAGEPIADLLDSYRADADGDFIGRVFASCRRSSTAAHVSTQDHTLVGLVSRPSLAGGICDLTNRELDILELLAQRLQNKEIASQLFISTHTVKDHLKHIYQKLDVNNRRQAVLRAVELDLITPV